MYDYMFQFSYADIADSWNHRGPDQHAEALVSLIKKLDGIPTNVYYTFAEFSGGVVIFQCPDIFRSQALVLAASVADDLKDIRYTRLLTVEEGRMILAKAALPRTITQETWTVPEPRGEAMTYNYMFQFVYTPEAWRELIQNPTNPAVEFAGLAEQHGGRLIDFFLTAETYFGGVAYYQGPTLQGPGIGIPVAAIATGKYQNTRFSRLVTVQEAVDTVKYLKLVLPEHRPD